ncbi:MAG: methyltransferase domain-containing protein [Azospirillum sp.]|nr:methyltransferase domain-containing protein [Azospirillum sp.]
MTDRLRAQYEAYPYPSRDPADERRRLITGSPSHLDEINHYVFGGQRNFGQPIRVLVAGGGTGDATIMLAQQLSDAGIPGHIDYLDLSEASRLIARARAEVRGLTNIRFHRGSLLALDELPELEPCYDYIDCCGVLHHLPAPEDGLAALSDVLAPGGGIGLMVYASLGRTGVYPLQTALRMVGDDLVPAEQVLLARRLLKALPESNWFRRNPYLVDHLQSDAGLYDLLLNSRDRAFTVSDLTTLVEGADLAIAALIEPMLYRPTTWVNDPRILKRLEPLSWLDQAAWSEQICGAIRRHVAYLVRPKDLASAVASPEDPEAIPILKDLDGTALAAGLAKGGQLRTELGGIAFTPPLPRLAAPLLARIDGKANLATLHQTLAELDGNRLSWPAFHSQFAELYSVLNGLNKLLLRLP